MSSPHGEKRRWPIGSPPACQGNSRTGKNTGAADRYVQPAELILVRTRLGFGLSFLVM